MLRIMQDRLTLCLCWKWHPAAGEGTSYCLLLLSPPTILKAPIGKTVFEVNKALVLPSRASSQFSPNTTLFLDLRDAEWFSMASKPARGTDVVGPKVTSGVYSIPVSFCCLLYTVLIRKVSNTQDEQRKVQQNSLCCQTGHFLSQVSRVRVFAIQAYTCLPDYLLPLVLKGKGKGLDLVDSA